MLNIDQIEEIKRKIDLLKEKKAKAEGAMENIRRRWKEEYGCENEEDVKKKLAALEEEIAEGERRLSVLLTKIEQAYDWSSV